jgi:Mitochondrial carrier protein
LLASVLGGSLAVWNHPLEVCRVEMQSMVKAHDRPAKMTVLSTVKYVYAKDGIRGLYRGVVPRIALFVFRCRHMFASSCCPAPLANCRRGRSCPFISLGATAALRT